MDGNNVRPLKGIQFQVLDTVSHCWWAAVNDFRWDKPKKATVCQDGDAFTCLVVGIKYVFPSSHWIECVIFIKPLLGCMSTSCNTPQNAKSGSHEASLRASVNTKPHNAGGRCSPNTITRSGAQQRRKWQWRSWSVMLGELCAAVIVADTQ